MKSRLYTGGFPDWGKVMGVSGNSLPTSVSLCILRAVFRKEMWTLRNIISGLIIYAIGDTAGALIAGEFSWLRMVGMSLIGGFWYAGEIPLVYKWIDGRVAHLQDGFKKGMIKTTWASLYFNPLWVARHLLFINLLMLNFGAIQWGLLEAGLWSFLLGLVPSYIGNYAIQNWVVFDWRFVASAVFSAIMAVYYAVTPLLF